MSGFLPPFLPTQQGEHLVVHVEVVVHQLEDLRLDAHQILAGDGAGDVLEEVGRAEGAGLAEFGAELKADQDWVREGVRMASR